VSMYKISLQSAKNGNELTLYGPVGESWEGFTAATVASELKKLESGPLTVRLNSPGGSAFDGVAIYNQLRACGRDRVVNVIVDGLAASAASVIAMAGDSIHMGPGAMLMVHDPLSFTIGNAAEHRRTTDLLDKVAGEIADVYAARLKPESSPARDLMREETWMTGSEAVALGLADTCDKSQVAASVTIPPLMAALFQRAPVGLAVIDSPRAERETQQEQSTMKAMILAALGLAEGDENTVKAAIAALRDRADAGDQARTELADVKARLSAVEKDREREQAAGLIEAAITEGRLAPAARDRAETMYAETGIKGLGIYLESLPKLISTEPVPAPKPDATAPDGNGSDIKLSDDDREYCRRVGLSEEWFLDAKRLYLAKGDQVG